MVAWMFRNPRRTRAGEPPRRGRVFPGQAKVICERPGEAELGVAGDDQPGPPVSSLRIADFRGGPAEDLLEQPEGVLEGRSGARMPASTGPRQQEQRWCMTTTATPAWGPGPREGARPADGSRSPR